MRNQKNRDSHCYVLILCCYSYSVVVHRRDTATVSLHASSSTAPATRKNMRCASTKIQNYRRSTFARAASRHDSAVRTGHSTSQPVTYGCSTYNSPRSPPAGMLSLIRSIKVQGRSATPRSVHRSHERVAARNSAVAVSSGLRRVEARIFEVVLHCVLLEEYRQVDELLREV